MKKIVKSLTFPAVALLIVGVIYVGLSIVNLNNQTKALQKQNQSISFNADTLQNKFNQLLSEVDKTKNQNNILSQNLTAAQNQISSLQSGRRISNIVAAAPATITQTITQTVDRPIIANQATVTIENVGSYKVDLQSGDNAFNILQRASQQNNFALKYDTYSFGIFVTSIGGITPSSNEYWAFYYNGTFSNVGASDQPVKLGDNITWQLASF